MPSQQPVRKETTWGGAAGIAVLAFALVYRFFPALLHVTPQQHLPSTTASRGPAVLGVRKQVEFMGPPEANDEMGPPRELADLGAHQPADSIESGTSVAEQPVSANAELLLGLADKALTEGHLYEPAAQNALALYQQVLEDEPNNRRAKAGMKAVKTALLAQVRDALDHGDAEEATAILGALDAVALAKDEYAALQDRLKVVKQVAPLLERAADLLKQGHVAEPPDANALAVYRQVRELDKDNALARQGLEQIQREVLDRVLGAVAQSDFAGADKLLAQASEILPGSQGMLDTRNRVEGLRRQQAEGVMEQARSALDAGRPDLAEQLSKRALAISADLTGVDEFNEKLRNARLYASSKPGETLADPFLDRSGTAPALVVIPAGRFQMGSPDSENGHRSAEEPQHEVILAAGIALGRSEVSVGQFRAFVRATGYRSVAEREGSSSIYDENIGRMTDSRASWQDDYRGRRADDNLPVVHVTFEDAIAYADWLSDRTGKPYRLPSEAEFEYALRAGQTTRFSWGEGDPPRVLGNFTGAGDHSPTHRTWSRAFARYSDGYWGPAPVQSFAPNAWGLYDLDGNVSEWTADCWHDNYVRATHDSRAWVNPGCERRVVRGGSWGSDPDQVRSAFRVSALTDTRSARVGFRVARDL